MEQDYIIIGFSKAKGCMPISKAIMLVEGTEYSHVYIKLYNKHFGDYDIYQASKGMVNHVTDSVFLEHNISVAEYKIPITSTKKMSTISYIRKKLGKPYSFITLIGIFIIDRLRSLGIKWSKLNCLFDGDKAYICSEFAARVVKDCEILPININVDTATPKQLHEIFKEYERNK